MISKKAILVAFSCASCAFLSAQGVSGGASAGSAPPPHLGGQITFPGNAMPFVPVTGAPFSGVQETEHTQTLTDGTHISRKMIGQKIWRDAAGRMRTERPMLMGIGAPENSPVVVEIVDPVAGYRYTLDTQGKVAHRVAIMERPYAPPAPPPGQTSAAGGVVRQGSMGGMVGQGSAGGSMIGSTLSTPSHIQSQHESLGTKTIDGLVVNGTKFTMTVPEGTQGNDRPISTVTESWASPELRQMIESTTSDPRNGESITRLTNIDRSNPDPSLFQVPPDYQIVDEQGPFSINYTRPQ